MTVYFDLDEKSCTLHFNAIEFFLKGFYNRIGIHFFPIESSFMYVAEETPTLIFTDNAARKVSDLIKEEEDNNGLMLRVFVQGGGCSGFQYGFTFDKNQEEGDTVVENQGVKLLVDPMSFQYLMGAEIDYIEGLEGAHFVIRNPNAVTTCGCGSSFAV